MSNLELPQSIITRLIKEGQSQQTANYIISKDFKGAFQQLGGFFSLYIYSIANDIAKEGRRKKVTEHDIYQALKEVGFDKYVEDLKDFMANYNADKEDTVGKFGATGFAKKRAGPNSGVSIKAVSGRGAGNADDMEDDDEELEQEEAGGTMQASKRLRVGAGREDDDEEIDIVDIK